jgi:hypothetical protein
MWIVYFALAIALLALAILLFHFVWRRASSAREAASSEYVTIASVFVNVATLLVALVALYIAFQALGQRGTPTAGIQPQRRPDIAANSAPQSAPLSRTPGSASPAVNPAAAAPQPVGAYAPAPVPPEPAPGAPTKSGAPATPPSPPPVPAASAGATADASVAPQGKPPTTGKPDVRLEFEMSRKALGVILVNESASDRATEIACQARLWDLDDPDDDSFSDPITTDCGTAYLNPRGVLGPARLAVGPSHQPRVIEKGDRFFGYVAVSCLRCVKARAYAVYFVLGANQGWYADEEPGDLLMVEFTRETANAAAQQFLVRTDKLPIRAFGGL